MSEITRTAIQAPLAVAMASEMSRHQFHTVAQDLLRDFDRVTAENAALQQRLNAADQRIDEQRVALMRIRDRADAFAEDERNMQVASVEVIRDIAARALGEVESPDQFRDVVKMIAERTPAPDFSLIGIVHTPPMEYDEP